MKRSFFNIFKNKSEYSSEDESQQEYAIKKEKERSHDISKPAKAEVSEETTEKAQFAKEKLESILTLSELGGAVAIGHLDNNKIELNISDTDELGRIIGKDGVAINALQTLIRQMVYQQFKSGIRVQIDAADYKRKREQTLRKDSLKEADKIKLGLVTKVELEPMNPSERRFIHGLFEEDNEIKSYSVGDGKSRHIILEKDN